MKRTRIIRILYNYTTKFLFCKAPHPISQKSFHNVTKRAGGNSALGQHFEDTCRGNEALAKKSACALALEFDLDGKAKRIRMCLIQPAGRCFFLNGKGNSDNLSWIATSGIDSFFVRHDLLPFCGAT